MKPLKLTIAAFGPYAGKTEIDMEKLSRGGMYLITGDTGAGKTTIFDAITYALFGEPSGDVREASMLRSNYAKPDTTTYVELVFRHAGKDYTIRRSPEYMRQAKKGNGLTKQAAGAELVMPDGRIITKIRDVDAHVNAILGVTRDQFSKTAMLAQGSFQKLLFSDTATKQEIFRTLFDTGRCQNIQKKLKDRANEVCREYTEGARGIRQTISMFQYLDPDGDDAKAARDEVTPVRDVMASMESVINDDVESEQKLEKRKKELEKEISTLEGDASKCREKERLERELAGHELTIAPLLKRKEDAETAFEKAKKEAEKAGEIKERAMLVRNSVPEHERMEELLKGAKAEEEKASALEKGMGDAEAKRTAAGQIIKALQGEAEAASEGKKDMGKLLAEKSGLERKSEKLEALESRIGDWKDFYYELKAIQEDGAKKQAESNVALSRYTSMLGAFLAGQAGVLAEKLENGVPCPVCGAVHHPAHAHKPRSVPTEAELDSAKAASDKAAAEAAKVAENAAGAKSKIDTCRKDCDRMSAELFPDTPGTAKIGIVMEEKGKMSETVRSLDAEIKAEKERAEKEERVGKLLKAEREKLSSLTESIQGDMQAKKTAEALAAQMRAQAEGMKGKLAYPTSKEASEAADRLESEWKALSDGLKDAETGRKETETAYLNARAKTVSLKEQILKAGEFDAEAIRTRLETAGAEKTATENRLLAVHARLASNMKTLDALKAQHEKTEEMEKEYRTVKVLSDTANGMLAGKEKVTFEAYVQMAYFDRILAQANTRLMVMSDGQYELKRAERAADAKSKSGLDINVIDHYNGTERSARSLSGGESFLASLSLALGLSDTVQSDAGGVQIDAMFIDEGFGSLDPETLHQAFRALSMLTEGDRVIGIISHVEELKTRIDNQIIVKKGSGAGSAVTVL